MGFLNPLLLIGTTAILAPIIIHMFMNRKVKPVVWAAMRFLQVSIQKNQKRMNLEDIILLLLRCLLLVLLALALARPVFRRGAAAITGRESEIAVIAIDNSYSMGTTDGGASRFELAKQAAEQVIDSMQPGSSTAVLLFSDIVHGSIPEPTYDLNLARKVIRDATISDRPTDVMPVLARSMDTLARHAGPGQKIYLITDGQATGWTQLGEITKTLHSESVKSTVVLVGSPEPHNLCVSNLLLASSMATTGEAAQFDIEVTNFSSTEENNVAVRISVDDDPPSDEGIISSIPPGASKRLSLFTKFRTPGYHTVTGRINGDHLTSDDERTIALRALDDVRVLLVTGDQGGDPVENAMFYLSHALVPVAASERENYFVKTKTIGVDELESTKLTDYEAVMLANVPDISPGAADALSAYLSHGGGLVIFPGPKTNIATYNGNLGDKYNLLPATLGAVRGKPEERKTVLNFQSKGYEHRIVSIWNDPGAGNLSSSNFYCSLLLTPLKGHPSPAGEPQMVLKYSDGTPAIMERTWGRGRVILFSSSANTAWNDLPLHPAFLPLMEQTLGAILDRQNDQLNVPVGTPLELVCDPDWVGRDALISHAGDNKDASSLRRINMVNGTPLLRFEETEQAGGYEVTVKTEPPTVVKFAVQSNASESDLADLTPGQLDSISQAAHVVHWTPGARLDQEITKERGGTEIWTIMAMLVIVIAIVETLMGGIFSASK